MTDTSLAPSIGVLLAHSDWVHALARELVADASVANDVVQETWLEVIERPPRTTTNARGWLATVLRNVVRDHARGESRRTRREQMAAREEAVAASDNLVAEAETGRALIGHVLALDEVYRTVVLQRFWEGMNPSQIARSQGTPVATVKTRLARGLEKLRSRLDESHDGNRGNWVSAVLPLARGGSPTATSGPAEGHAVQVSSAAFAVLVIVSVVVFVVVREPPASSKSALQPVAIAAVESEQPKSAGLVAGRVPVAGAPGSDREPVASPDEPPNAGSSGSVGAKETPAPVVILGEGKFDPGSDGPRAIALDSDGSLIAFEYGDKGQCLVFDRSGTIRAGMDDVGYCSEAVRVGDSIFLTVPKGRLVKFNTVSLKNEGSSPVNDNKGAWLCNALCVSDGVIHVGSGDEGRIYMFDMNMKPQGSWGSSGLMCAMDAAGQRIFVAESGAENVTIRAFEGHGTDTPTVLGDSLSINGVVEDLCALDEAHVLIVKEEGQILQCRCDPAGAAGEQWILQGQTDLAAEPWFAPSNGISRAAYDPQKELLYISFRSPHGRIVAVPYSAQSARRKMVPR